MLRSARIVLNGKAGSNVALRAAVAEARDDGHGIDVCVTWEASDAARLAAEAVRQEVDVVIAAGGDGTLNEVANGVLQAGADSGTAVGLIPFGTANDFATACGVPLGDPHAALMLALEAEPTSIDMGRVNGRFFVNVASGGLGAEVTVRTPSYLKNVLGGAAYAIMGVVMARELSPYHCRATIEGQSYEAELLLLSLGNGRLAGGGRAVAPRALLDDGRLDLLAIHDVRPKELGALLGEVLDLGSEDRRFAHYRQVESLELEFDRDFPLNLDGETMLARSFQIDVVPNCLPIVLPAGCELLKAPSPAPVEPSIDFH